ncbi:hypothetical protein SPHINGO8BC_110291 [Sphingobacterium multivorum]|uniref:Uncharacterized protein n=1 Tax=Sphingobacterium multivorum TaxID=28454 RepID=A0A653YTG2_SPHMU|nr:hypothetical protein SPHINGO8BC_110291 [Sphingobacterium multivorum]
MAVFIKVWLYRYNLEMNLFYYSDVSSITYLLFPKYVVEDYF